MHTSGKSRLEVSRPSTSKVFIQALGPINDQLEGCMIEAQVERARGSFKRSGHD
ncbi:MAG: hypothetical protein OFPI_42350 [Osedax symbiont Rs2]|nr:MAG: hypothetical protein OFPI_42350 [Osedax symbiont Rs2]